MKEAVLSLIKLLDIKLSVIKLQEISLQGLIGSFSPDKKPIDRGRYKTVNNELYRLADGRYYLVKQSNNS